MFDGMPLNITSGIALATMGKGYRSSYLFTTQLCLFSSFFTFIISLIHSPFSAEQCMMQNLHTQRCAKACLDNWKRSRMVNLLPDRVHTAMIATMEIKIR
jgi:hypothetical protein